MNKKRILFNVFLMAMLIVSSNVFAANTVADNDFFVGKWNLVVKNTPMGGDMNSTMEITKADGKLTGKMTMGDPSMGMSIDFSKVTVEGDKLTVSFDMMGNQATIEYTKKDADSITGKMMDSPIEGTRVKE